MITKHIEFRYKGTRNYIHGTDMYNVMTAGYDPGSLHSISFAVHGFVHSSSCTLVESTSKLEAQKIKDVLVRCQYRTDGLTHYLSLLGGVEQSKTRYDYDENNVVTRMHINAECVTLDRMSPYTFIETIVAMNKYHLLSLFPDAPGQWVFSRIDLKQNYDDRIDLGLLFRHNMAFRLTKSDIFIKREKVGHIYFSLVKS